MRTILAEKYNYYIIHALFLPSLTNATLFSLSRHPDFHSNVVFAGMALLKCYQNHFYVNPVTFDNVNHIIITVNRKRLQKYASFGSSRARERNSLDSRIPAQIFRILVEISMHVIFLCYQYEKEYLSKGN